MEISDVAETVGGNDRIRRTEGLAGRDLRVDAGQRADKNLPPGECDDGNSIPWDGCTDGKITEFRVNQFTEWHQTGGRLAALLNGSVAIAWTSGSPDGAGQDGDGLGVYARVYESTGVELSSEFALHQVTAGYQWSSRLVGLPDGRFIALWLSGQWWGEPPETLQSLRGRVFDEFGGPEGDEWSLYDSLGVDTYTVVWPTGLSALMLASVGEDCEAQFVPPDGSCHLAGGQLEVETGSQLQMVPYLGLTGSSQRVGRAALGPNGEIMFGYSQLGEDGKCQSLVAHLADDATVQGLPTQLAHGDSAIGCCTSLLHFGDHWAATRLVATGDGEAQVVLQVFDVDGKPTAPEIPLTDIAASNGCPQLHPQGETGLMVVWTSGTDSPTENDVFTRTVSWDGSAVHSTRLCHTFVSGGQWLVDSLALPNNRIFVVWNSMEQDGDGSGVYGIILDEAGNPVNWF